MAEISSKPVRCPDNGTCHHGCESGNCFRVGFCGPLSGVFPHNQWPEDLRFDEEAHLTHLDKMAGLARQKETSAA